MPEVTDLIRVAQWAKSAASCAGPPEVYNAACRLLDTDNSAKVATNHLLDRTIDLAHRVGRAEAKAAQLKDERDALQAEVARLRTAQIEREAIVKATHSHGCGQTPQTQGAVEGQEAREAQEGSQCRICHGALPPGYVCGNCRTVYPKVGQPYPMREPDTTP